MENSFAGTIETKGGMHLNTGSYAYRHGGGPGKAGGAGHYQDHMYGSSSGAGGGAGGVGGGCNGAGGAVNSARGNYFSFMDFGSMTITMQTGNGTKDGYLNLMGGNPTLASSATNTIYWDMMVRVSDPDNYPSSGTNMRLYDEADLNTELLNINVSSEGLIEQSSLSMAESKDYKMTFTGVSIGDIVVLGRKGNTDNAATLILWNLQSAALP